MLSNDPGAAKLYSLSQDAAALAGTTQFPILTAVTLQSGASISINTDGTIHYNATAIQHALQALAEGENFTDSFVYTVRMANGALSTATATVTIAGVNDAPTLASITPVTVNDTAANDTPVPFTGQLVGADVDHGAVLAYSLGQGVDATNAYGTLTLDAATGAYAFAADPAALNALAVGENKTVSFGVLVTDEHGATAAQAIQFNLVGANDGPTLASIAPVTVNDTAAKDAPAPFTGQLVGADVDHGAVLAYSLAQGVDATNAYGTLTLDAATGAYAFAADPAALNALAASENQTVSFGVLVTDEHGATAAQAIQFNLVGVNDTAEISGEVAGAVTEDGTLTANGTLTVSDRDHGQSLFITANDADLHGQYGDFTFNTNGEWSYLLRNGDTSVQALNSGDTKTDSLLIGSFDGSAINTISVTINGANEPVVVTQSAPVNPVTDYMVNYGRTDVNGIQNIVGFDSNDRLTYSSNYNYILNSLQHVDTNGDGANDSSTAQFDFTTGNSVHHIVTVELVGYADLTSAQIG